MFVSVFLQLSHDTQCVCMSFAAAGTKLWSNVMEILDEKDGVDTELLVYAMTLINKVNFINLSSALLLYRIFFHLSVKSHLNIVLKCNPVFTWIRKKCVNVRTVKLSKPPL